MAARYDRLNSQLLTKARYMEMETENAKNIGKGRS